MHCSSPFGNLKGQETSQERVNLGLSMQGKTEIGHLIITPCQRRMQSLSPGRRRKRVDERGARRNFTSLSHWCDHVIRRLTTPTPGERDSIETGARSVHVHQPSAAVPFGQKLSCGPSSVGKFAPHLQSAMFRNMFLSPSSAQNPVPQMMCPSCRGASPRTNERTDGGLRCSALVPGATSG